MSGSAPTYEILTHESLVSILEQGAEKVVWGQLNEDEIQGWVRFFEMEDEKLKPSNTEKVACADLYAWLYFTKYLTGGEPLGRDAEPSKKDLDWLKVVFDEQKTPEKGTKYRIKRDVFRGFFPNFNAQIQAEWEDLEKEGIQGKAYHKFTYLIAEGFPKRGDAMVQAALKEDPEEFKRILGDRESPDRPDGCLGDSDSGSPDVIE